MIVLKMVVAQPGSEDPDPVNFKIGKQCFQKMHI